MIAGLTLASLICTAAVTAVLVLAGVPLLVCACATPVEMLGFWCLLARRRVAQ